MPNYQEILYVFCGQSCARKAYRKTTLWKGKCQRETKNPLRRCLQRSIGSGSRVKMSGNAEIDLNPTVLILAFLTTLCSHYWDYFTCVLVNIAEMSESCIKGMGIPVRNKDSPVRTCLGPELMKRAGKSTCKCIKQTLTLRRFFVIDYVRRRLFHV